MSIPYKMVQDMIEGSEFCGPTNDECYELFDATCKLSYQFAGVGELDRAFLLAMWAREMATQSEIDAEEFEPLTERTKGQWGS